MKYCIVVLASPSASEAGDSAWRFVEAALQSKHQVPRVFFYHEGAYHGSRLSVFAQDESNRVQRWAELAEASGTELVLCVASALKRGMLDQAEAQRYEKACANIHPAFVLGGLGQLVDASAHCDRLLTFGA